MNNQELAMLCRARFCYANFVYPLVSPSICNVQLLQSYALGYFVNNYTVD